MLPFDLQPSSDFTEAFPRSLLTLFAHCQGANIKGAQLRGATMRSPNTRMGVGPGTRLRGVSGQPVRSGEGVKQGARVSRHDAATVD